ncbi:MAG TPA: hypothetical protein VML00_01015 [Bacteroidota bacterium]|nr:hypothetical protein [Bacteroidota bacterium]
MNARGGYADACAAGRMTMPLAGALPWSILLGCGFLLGAGVPASRAQGRPGLPADTLAEVGTTAVTARDLIERLELMPWPEKERGGKMDSIKVKALESLVAERILALEASARGVVDDSTLRRHTKSLEHLMVRDELYKREVTSNVQVDEKEIQEGMRRSLVTVTILVLGLRSRETAGEVSAALLAGERVDSVIARFRAAPGITVDTALVRFGLLEKPQEDAVYALTRERPASGPLGAPDGSWMVAVLLDRQKDPEFAKRSFSERGMIAAARVRKRKEAARAQQYSAATLAPARAEAVPRTFELVARVLRAIIERDSAVAKTEGGYRIDRVADIALDSLRSHGDDPLVEYGGGAMTVEDILEGFRTAAFVIPTLRNADFRQHLSGCVREIVAREFLAREGYRQRLERTAEVRHDVDTWSRYWLAQAMTEKLARDVNVTPEEVLAAVTPYARELGENYEVNVREILSDSLRESLDVMAQIVAGADMGRLARERSKRSAWAARDGESGLFPVSRYPALGIRALDAERGALVGPVRVPEGYSLFTLLDKRSARRDSLFMYDSLKAAVRGDLAGRRIRARVNSFVAAAAGSYRVKINYARVSHVDIPPINMVTRRFIGFGGSMLAVPTLYPLWEWTGERTGATEILP